MSVNIQNGDGSLTRVDGGGGSGGSLENLAIIESTSESTHAYSEGDMLVFNGRLYSVVESISIGDTLTPNTNISLTSVAEEIDKKNNDVGFFVNELGQLCLTYDDGT